MPYKTWHHYGYGVCTSKLKIVSVERIEKLLSLAPDFRKDIHDWFNEVEITKPKIDDYIDFDQDYNNGIAAILKEVIEEATGIELLACNDFDCNRYLIYVPLYPWQIPEQEKSIAEEDIKDILIKYISIVSDSEIVVDYQEIENGG